MDYAKMNLKLATNDEIMRLLWECEETHDKRLKDKLTAEINRRIKYDY